MYVDKSVTTLQGNQDTVAENTVTPSSAFIAYVIWGLDLSGTLQGAGGVGGLLAVFRDDGIFAPTYDANGNISEYISLVTSHSSLVTDIVAHYEYDAFGNIAAQSGDLADDFTFRFSTKPYCTILNKVEYQLRIYDPTLGRWMSRDPIKEAGGLNLYGFCINNSINYVDPVGLVINYSCSRENKKKHQETIDKWLKELPKDSELRKMVEALQKSKNKHTINDLPKGVKIPYVHGRSLIFPNDPGGSQVFINPQNYVVDGTTFSYEQALVHELLHSHDYETDNPRRTDILGQGHDDSFFNELQKMFQELEELNEKCCPDDM